MPRSVFTHWVASVAKWDIISSVLLNSRGGGWPEVLSATKTISPNTAREPPTVNTPMLSHDRSPLNCVASIPRSSAVMTQPKIRTMKFCGGYVDQGPGWRDTIFAAMATNHTAPVRKVLTYGLEKFISELAPLVEGHRTRIASPMHPKRRIVVLEGRAPFALRPHFDKAPLLPRSDAALGKKGSLMAGRLPLRGLAGRFRRRLDLRHRLSRRRRRWRGRARFGDGLRCGRLR